MFWSWWSNSVSNGRSFLWPNIFCWWSLVKCKYCYSSVYPIVGIFCGANNPRTTIHSTMKLSLVKFLWQASFFHQAQSKLASFYQGCLQWRPLLSCVVVSCKQKKWRGIHTYRVRIGVACVAQCCRCLCVRCSRGIGGMFLHENFLI